MITEEKINLNYATFTKVLDKYGLLTEKMKMDGEFVEKLRTSPAHLNIESGGAYPGALIENIMLITDYAKKLNQNVISERNRVDNTSLLKVCFLHQIAKAEQYVKNDSDWGVKNGKIYKFSPNCPALKTGEFSTFLCQKYGIELTTFEYEAIISIDKTDDDLQAKYHGNILSKILKAANELVDVERKSNWLTDNVK